LCCRILPADDGLDDPDLADESDLIQMFADNRSNIGHQHTFGSQHIHPEKTVVLAEVLG
jgi:hypothetical protein